MKDNGRTKTTITQEKKTMFNGSFKPNNTNNYIKY